MKRYLLDCKCGDLVLEGEISLDANVRQNTAGDSI